MSQVVEILSRLHADLYAQLAQSPAFREYEVIGRAMQHLKLSELVETTEEAEADCNQVGDIRSRAHANAIAALSKDSSVTSRISLVDLTILRLHELGSPQTTSQLNRYLEALGRPSKSLVTSLSRDYRVVSIPWNDGKAWWLRNAVPGTSQQSPADNEPTAEASPATVLGIEEK